MSISSIVVQNICKQGTECVLRGAHSRQGLCAVGGWVPGSPAPGICHSLGSQAVKRKGAGVEGKGLGVSITILV